MKDLDNGKYDVALLPGMGKEQAWYFDLKKRLEALGLSVWYEAFPENTGKDIARNLSKKYQKLIHPDLTAVTYSASTSAFFHAMLENSGLRSGGIIKSAITIAGWLEDPITFSEENGGEHGRRVKHVFTENNEDLLKPFIERVEDMRYRMADISNLIRRKVFVVQSENDPYVAPEQADFIAKKLGGQIINVQAGHFQEKRGENKTLPEKVVEKIISTVEGPSKNSNI